MRIGIGGTLSRTLIRVPRTTLLAACALLFTARMSGGGIAHASSQDSRVRVAVYEEDTIYRLEGYVGYQIDLQFEPGETFVGLGAGDLRGIRFAAQTNHLL